MRKSVLAIIALATLSVSGQVKLQSPASIVIGVKGTDATLRVFYTVTGEPAEPQVSITDVGELRVAELTKEVASGVSVSTPTPGVVKSVLIRVKAPPNVLKSGDTFTGALIFSNGTNVVSSFPVTVSRPKPVFTATALDADVCLTCGEPKALMVQLANTGEVPIDKVRVGTIAFRDGARHHRWLTPERGVCEETTAASDPMVIAACSEGVVALAPGQQKKISVPIEQPTHAGDYSATFDVSAEGGSQIQVTAIVRTRGPNLVWWLPLPLVLFLILVILGASIAYVLEQYFGAGAGKLRLEAEASLRATRIALLGHLTWVSERGLGNTQRRIESDLVKLDAVLDQTGTTAPVTLAEEAQRFAERLDKRRRLRLKAEYALKTRKEAWHPRLDAEQDSGDADAYEARLDAILNGPAEDLSEAPARSAEEQVEDDQNEKKRIRRAQRFFTVLRWTTLLVVSILTAYLTLYDGKCSFGSTADYITTFLWGLGLTQAGNSLIGEARSKYTRPAEGTTP